MGVPLRHSKGYTAYSEIRHDIIIDKDTLLYKLADTDRINVNSYHHQAPRESSLPSSLKVVARADDGVVEAMEYIGESPFFLTIQWNPEKAPEEPFSKAVLQAFADACHIFENQHHHKEEVAEVEEKTVEAAEEVAEEVAEVVEETKEA